MSIKSLRRVTTAVLIDSLRHDMLGEETPFLLKIAEQGVTGILEPPLAYCLHPTWFAGLHPESSDRFLRHIYSPQTSPYKRLRLISFLERNRFTKLSSGFARHHLLRNPYGVAHFIPNHMLKYFDVAEKFPPWHPQCLPQATTLFDTLRESDLKWLFIGSPGSDQRTFSVLNKFQKMISNKYSFIWLHFAELDWACHKYGPGSAQSKGKLQEIDRAIETIHSYLSNTYSTVNTLIFGDHGHVKVNQTLDIGNLLKQTSLRIGEDYIYFIDSTITRFWFKNEQAREAITNILSTVDCGKVLSKQDSKRYGCNFQNLKHGQLIWVADEECIILPNFWQGTTTVRGMHGYLPEVQDNHARFVLSGPQVHQSEKLEEKCKLVDIFPTLLDLMHLPIPETNEGSSILHNAGRE